MIGLDWAAIEPATSRHTNLLLPLLPSGPGGVHSVSLREDRPDHHYVQLYGLKTAIMRENGRQHKRYLHFFQFIQSKGQNR